MLSTAMHRPINGDSLPPLPAPDGSRDTFSSMRRTSTTVRLGSRRVKKSNVTGNPWNTKAFLKRALGTVTPVFLSGFKMYQDKTLTPNIVSWRVSPFIPELGFWVLVKRVTNCLFLEILWLDRDAGLDYIFACVAVPPFVCVLDTYGDCWWFYLMYNQVFCLCA